VVEAGEDTERRAGEAPPDPIRYGTTRLGLSNPNSECFPIWLGDFAGWYRTKIDLAEIGDDELVFLSFESVNLVSSVWVEDIPVMMGHYGLFPFAVEVTEELRYSGAKTKTVAVKAGGIATNLPYLFSNGYQAAYHYPPFMTGRNNWDYQDNVWAGIAADVTVTVANKRSVDSLPKVSPYSALLIRLPFPTTDADSLEPDESNN